MNTKLRLEELNRLNLDDYREIDKHEIILVLDNVRSLNNVGAVFRTADAFRIKEIHLCGITPKPPHRDIQKTALGATESVNWKYFESVMDSITELRHKGYKIAGIEQTSHAVKLCDFFPEPDEKWALVFGNEVEGVQQKIIDQSDTVLEIPQLGTKHSFNISVSVGIVLWDFANKMAFFE